MKTCRLFTAESIQRFALLEAAGKQNMMYYAAIHLSCWLHRFTCNIVIYASSSLLTTAPFLAAKPCSSIFHASSFRYNCFACITTDTAHVVSVQLQMHNTDPQDMIR